MRRAGRAGAGVGQHGGRLATMNVCLHERRVVGLGRRDRRSIELLQDPTSGNNRLGHTRDLAIHGRHIDFDRGLRPCQGRRSVINHT